MTTFGIDSRYRYKRSRGWKNHAPSVSPQRACFDARWIGAHGIGRFANEIRSRAHSFHNVQIAGLPVDLLDSVRLGRFLRRTKPGLYFNPGYTVPVGANCPVVPTIHDLIHLHFPGHHSFAKKTYYLGLQRPIIRRCELVVTVSDYSKSMIVDWYGIDPGKVLVLGNAASDEFSPEGPRISGRPPFFLCIANEKPHKNLVRLLKSFAKIAGQVVHQLVLVLPSVDRLPTVAADFGIFDRVEFVRGLSNPDLAMYYRSAECLVFPSLQEGFGLPAVEAMASGCPVLAANASALPEVIGDAGTYFDPYCVESLADALLSVARDELPLSRMRVKGVTQAAKFSWQAYAQCLEERLNDCFSFESLNSTGGHVA